MCFCFSESGETQGPEIFLAGGLCSPPAGLNASISEPLEYRSLGVILNSSKAIEVRNREKNTTLEHEAEPVSPLQNSLSLIWWNKRPG